METNEEKIEDKKDTNPQMEKTVDSEKEKGNTKSVWKVFSKSNKGSHKKKHDKDVEMGDDLASMKEGKDNEKAKSNFPCCCYIPLDIAMQGFALIDIVRLLLFN